MYKKIYLEGYIPSRVITRIISAPLGITEREALKYRDANLRAFPLGGYSYCSLKE